MSGIIDRLKTNKIFFDGAMGTMLHKKGIKSGELPDLYNITNRDIIIDIHKEYIAAGCDVITTNTFGSNSYKLAGTEYTTEDIVSQAINNAKEAIKQMGKAGEVFVACDIGPIGKLLSPIGDVTFDSAYKSYKSIVDAACKSGADLFLIETMSDIYDAKAAILACKENSDLPVFCTMTLEKNDRTLTGSDVVIIGQTLESLQVDAVGLNCSRGPNEMTEVVKLLSKSVNIPVIVQPNAGLPHTEGEDTIFPVEPLEFAHAVQKLAYPQVSIFGGCCGTTPDHIRELIKVIGRESAPVINKSASDLICSSTKYNDFSNESIRSRDIVLDSLSDVDDVIDEIYEQVDEGCEVVSLLLKEYTHGELSNLEFCDQLNEIQSIIKLPFIFKTSSDRLASLALRYYNGKPGLIRI